MAPAITIAATLLLSVVTAPSADHRADVVGPAPWTVPVARAQEATAAASTDAVVVAVTVFSNITGVAEDDWIGLGSAETLMADVASIGALSVVGRQALSDTLENLRASQSSEAETAEVRAGRLLGARWVIAGTYEWLGNQLQITGRILDIASAAIVHTTIVDGLATDLFALQDRLSGDLRRGLPAPRGWHPRDAD